MFHDEKTPEAQYSELLALDLDTVESSLAGPKRPQDRVALAMAGDCFRAALPSLLKPKSSATLSAQTINPVGTPPKPLQRWEQEGGNPAGGSMDHLVEEHVPRSVAAALRHGSVVIAAITSCTNT